MEPINIGELTKIVSDFKEKFPKTPDSALMMHETTKQRLIDNFQKKNQKFSPLYSVDRFLGLDIISFDLVPTDMAIPFKNKSEALDFIEYAQYANKWGINLELAYRMFQHKLRPRNDFFMGIECARP